MSQFKAFDENVEVSGRAVMAVMSGMGIFQKKAREILASHGLENLQPDRWYPQQSWLNAFKRISAELGDRTLFEIGGKIPESAFWPEDIENIQDGLRSINTAYEMNHRGGKIGRYEYFDLDDRTARLICSNPYPESFDHGLITAVANRYKPSGTFMAEVKLDASLPNRNTGADFGSYIVTW